MVAPTTPQGQIAAPANNPNPPAAPTRLRGGPNYQALAVQNGGPPTPPKFYDITVYGIGVIHLNFGDPCR